MPNYELINEDDGRTKRWFNQEGCLHRLDGPAVEEADGTRKWYVNGKLHRLDGPAIEYSEGGNYWYINNICIAERGFDISIVMFMLNINFDTACLLQRLIGETYE